MVSGEGEGMVRRCVARGGKDWTETCTLWAPGRRQAVEVHPAGYPFPLTIVGCLSYVESSVESPVETSVEPGAAVGHRIGAVFQLQPKAGLAGQVMLLVMHLGRPIVHRIVRGWDRTARQRPAEVVTPRRATP